MRPAPAWSAPRWRRRTFSAASCRCGVRAGWMLGSDDLHCCMYLRGCSKDAASGSQGSSHSCSLAPSCLPSAPPTGEAGAPQGARAAAGAARQHPRLLPRAPLSEVRRPCLVLLLLLPPPAAASAWHVVWHGPCVWCQQCLHAARSFRRSAAPALGVALAAARRLPAASATLTLAPSASTPTSGGSRSLSSMQCSMGRLARWAASSACVSIVSSSQVQHSTSGAVCIRRGAWSGGQVWPGLPLVLPTVAFRHARCCILSACVQVEVFDEVWPLIRSCADGYNVCILAYGQTGSGKTHSMMGPQQDPGMVHLVAPF